MKKHVVTGLIRRLSPDQQVS